MDATPEGYRAEPVTEDGIRYISVSRWEGRHNAWRMVFSIEIANGESDAAARQRAIASISRPGEFFDHTGALTSDPRCELGLCQECLEDAFARMTPVPVPALSPIDPAYKTDEAYRARYRRALTALGVHQRPLTSDPWEDRDPEPEDIIALSLAGEDDASQEDFDQARAIVADLVAAGMLPAYLV